MPSIKKNVKQIQAMEQISNMLQSLETIQKFSEDTTAELAIIYVPEGKSRRSKENSITLAKTNKEFKRVFAVLNSFKARIKKECLDLADKNEIEFSEEEMDILNGKISSNTVDCSDQVESEAELSDEDVENEDLEDKGYPVELQDQYHAVQNQGGFQRS